MYYLKKEANEKTVKEIVKTDGTVIPKRKYMQEARAIYKHGEYERFYRGSFNGINGTYQDMNVFKTDSLEEAIAIREDTFIYCKEYFDVYDENGIVDVKK